MGKRKKLLKIFNRGDDDEDDRLEWDGSRISPLRRVERFRKIPLDEPLVTAIEVKADKFGERIRFQILDSEYKVRATFWWDGVEDSLVQEYFIKGV